MRQNQDRLNRGPIGSSESFFTYIEWPSCSPRLPHPAKRLPQRLACKCLS
ncbi:hypothetical protein ACSS6W_005122 [Trichoderma asperelloides]